MTTAFQAVQSVQAQSKQSKHPSKMTSYSEKFMSSFIRNALYGRQPSIVKVFEAIPLKEVKVINPNFNTYTVITINPYTLEEQMRQYPVVIVHQ